jgi:glycosyltransferase involved in cell wall biosynthesis
LPIVLSVDATVWDWHAMGIWRSVRGWSRRALAPSLRLERRAFSAAWRVAAYTRWTADAVRHAAPDARIVELHPGVDLERWRPEPREPRERPRALFVGGRFSAKGGADLLEVARPLLGEALDLDIVTGARVPGATGVRVHRLQPNDPALVRLFRQADVFVLPTYGDAVPWAVLEAMACGVPVVAYDVGAIGELLDHGRAGVLIERGDRDGLRAALGELLADPERRQALGRAGRAHVEAQHDGRVQAQRLVRLLRAAVEETRAA